MPFKGKTVYISGAVSSDPDFKAKFDRAEKHVMAAGAKRCINPTSVLPDDWEYHEQMAHCMLMVQHSEVIAMLSCWSSSPGAKAERAYAESLKRIIVELPMEGISCPQHS